MPAFHQIPRTPLTFIAALSLLALVGVGVWRITELARAHREGSGAPSRTETNPSLGADWEQEKILLGITDSYDPAATSSSDTLSMIGPEIMAQLLGSYLGMKQQGSYTTDAGASTGENLATNVRAAVTYKTYDISDFKTDTDTSFERMLTYRADLRAALGPLLDNKDSEFEVYAKYLETSDPAYLEKLTVMSKRYHAATEAALKIVVPRDAVNYHRSIFNAMEEFAAVIDALSTHGGDPFASAALLRSFNAAEEHMYTSFNALASYYSQKTP